MVKIGLDLSINSTGVCINNVSRGTYKYYIVSSKETKKLKEFKNKYITIVFYNKLQANAKDSYNIKEQYKTNNLINISKCIRDIIKKELKKDKDIKAYIEGVSYGSMGSAAIVDLTGLNFIIRSMLKDLNVPFEIVSPTANKKFAVGNGGADKDVIIAAWKNCDSNIKNINDIKIDDLADAYFLSNYTES